MVDAVMTYVIQNVGMFLNKESNLLFGVRDKVEEMQNELKWMNCFLKDAERRKGESELVQNWVSEIRSLAYDVEDVIEHFVLKSALRNRDGVKNLIHKYSINRGVEIRQTSSRIEGIKGKLSNLRNSLQTYGIREIKVGGEEVIIVGVKKRQDYVHVLDHNVVGLDEKITELVQHLLNGEEAPVVCVYGMGGLGKTTTAKQVYSDQRIRGHFEGFAWVYISQHFNSRQVWESILSQLLDKLSDRDKKYIEKMKDDELLSKLFSIQNEKKCLIVIDDIWRNQDWKILSVAFPCTKNDSRSKILVTSRNESVVSHGVYRTSLHILDKNASLELLINTILFLGSPNHPIREKQSKGSFGKDKVIKGCAGVPQIPSLMEKLAESMVQRCAGLPLAIVVLGGILATKHELAEWEGVNASIKSMLKRGGRKENDHGVSNVLESSYDDLPYNLKSCFLYFSKYPEDAEIKTTELKQKWIGEGFVPPSMEDSDETVEDIAEEYLNDLVSRCMIQAGRRGYTGRVKTCRVHDMMRDLCIEKAKEAGFAHSIKAEVENHDPLEKVSFRRLSIFFGGNKHGQSILPSVETFSQLRSVGVYNAYSDREAVRSIIKKLKFARVLQLTRGNCNVGVSNDRGEDIGNLIHLRCLFVCHPKVFISIGNLRLLQTLNMEKCDSFNEIPDSVWGMDQLRHLYLPPNSQCKSNTQQVGDFRNLQTLVNFPPFKFDVREHLAKFAGVRKLVTNKVGEEIILEEASRQDIVFNRLQSLLGGSTFKVDMETIKRASPCLQKLVHRGPIQFSGTCSSMWPINLTKLVLESSHMNESHMGSLGKLQNLKILVLNSEAFIGKEFICRENDFPKLQHLKLEDLENLEKWVIHEGALPMLSSLEIVYLCRLKSVPEGTQFLTQLKEVHLNGILVPISSWSRVSDVASFSYTE